METKSQLSLRSLDVGGRSLGTERLSPVQSNGTDFLTKLNQGLAEVQQEEARSRRRANEATSKHAEERSAQADRDQSRGSADRLERRAQGEEHLAERQQSGREAGDSRAERRRAEGRPEREQRAVDAAPAHEPQKDELASEVPSAPTTPPRDASTSQQAQSSVSSSNTAGTGTAPGGAPAPLVQPTAAAAAGVAPIPKTGAGAQAASNQPATAQTQRSEAAPRPTRVARAAQPAPTAQDLERADAVLRQVKVSLKPGLRAANLQLHPAELGRITIRLRVQDDGVQAVLRAESEATLATLERHLPELRAILAQQGFAGAEFDLGLASQSDQGAAQNDSQSGRGASADGPIEEEMHLDAMALARPLAAAEGGVDFLA